MVWYKLLFLSLTLTISLANVIVSSDKEYCPEIKGCSNCTLVTDFSFSLNCISNENETFILTYNPQKSFIIIDCNHNSTLDNFYLQSHTFIQFINKVQIENCKIQNNATLINFTKALGMKGHNLEELILLNSTFISSITTEHFASLTNTVSLSMKNISQNNSREISETTFQRLNNLLILNLQKLHLKTLQHDLFANTTNLTSLDLSHNQLTSLNTNPFNQLKNLTKLYLSHNRITLIHGSHFRYLKQLEQLDLSHNKITRLVRKSFSGLQKLKQLSLSQNYIAIIHGDAFKHLKNLKVLDLSHNRLSTLNAYKGSYPKSVFHHCKSMVELILHHNRIMQIYNDWLDFTNLRVLNLQKNIIPQIRSKDLAFKSNDVYLNLMQNHIRNIYIDPHFLNATIKKNPDMVNVLVDFSLNPIKCDCHLYNFTRYFENKLRPDIKRVFHFVASRLECNKPSYLKGELTSEIQSKTLLCHVQDKCKKTECAYFWNPHYKTFLKNCSVRNYLANYLRMKQLERSLLNNNSKMFFKQLPKCDQA